MEVNDIAHLGDLWASCIYSGINAETALEFLMEEFADHPGRYELFVGAANFSMRTGRVELAEQLFFNCLADSLDGQWSFNQIVRKYDNGADGYNAESNHLSTARYFLVSAQPYLKEKRGLTLIDAACGTGALASCLRSYADNLIGIELSSGMAEIARHNYDNMIIGDMCVALNELGPIADGVFCSGAAYYFHDLTPFLRGAAGALKPGGFLMFTDFAAPDDAKVMVTIDGTKRHCRSPVLLREIAAISGFVVEGFHFSISYGLPVRIWRFIRI